jgi:hypothetical protein
MNQDTSGGARLEFRPFAARPGGRWPGRPLLVARLREILRREFRADDAWVVYAGRACRLEARSQWRVRVLLEGEEETFWAPFYTAAVRHRRVGGQMVGELAPTQRRRSELVEILRPLWTDAPVASAPEAS